MSRRYVLRVNGMFDEVGSRWSVLATWLMLGCFVAGGVAVTLLWRHFEQARGLEIATAIAVYALLLIGSYLLLFVRSPATTWLVFSACLFLFGAFGSMVINDRNFFWVFVGGCVLLMVLGAAALTYTGRHLSPMDIRPDNDDPLSR